MSITIKVARELDDEFVSDVLITAFDGMYGACLEWTEERKYRIDTSSDQWIEVRVKPDDEVGVTFIDAAIRNGELLPVDKDCIQVGLQRIVDEDFTDGRGINEDIRKDVLAGVLEEDAGAIDATAADCIVQAGLFGRIIFS